jgi:hypothetical protein
MAGK